MKVPEQLERAAEAAKQGSSPSLTVRELLAWYGYARRGSTIVAHIRSDLEGLGVETEPDFEGEWIDAEVRIRMARPPTEWATDPMYSAVTIASPLPRRPAAEVSPSHRISRLKAANTRPLSIKPDETLEKAVTLLMSHDYSQLPVMIGEREVKGMLSWQSIGQRLALGKECRTAGQCMEPHQEVPHTASIFHAIRLVAQYDCVLVRDGEKKISGIVTATDISEQFQLLSEPFLLLGDIENEIRLLIRRASFTLQQLQASVDPGDSQRVVDGVDDLSFGEYIRLLQNDANWSQVRLALDRKVFTAQLDEVRKIRNDVMHFDPDGITGDQLHQLRSFATFLERTLRLTT